MTLQLIVLYLEKLIFVAQTDCQPETVGCHVSNASKDCPEEENLPGARAKGQSTESCPVAAKAERGSHFWRLLSVSQSDRMAAMTRRGEKEAVTMPQ